MIWLELVRRAMECETKANLMIFLDACRDNPNFISVAYLMNPTIEASSSETIYAKVARDYRGSARRLRMVDTGNYLWTKHRSAHRKSEDYGQAAGVEVRV